MRRQATGPAFKGKRVSHTTICSGETSPIAGECSTVEQFLSQTISLHNYNILLMFSYFVHGNFVRSRVALSP